MLKSLGFCFGFFLVTFSFDIYQDIMPYTFKFVYNFHLSIMP